MVNITVRPVHFEDFSGVEFERLVFAFHLRAGWGDLAWYGQTGSDLGRDIIGTEIFDDRPNQITVIQCANRVSLSLSKAERDMALALTAPTGAPVAFKFVCRSAVSANMRDQIRAAGKDLGIPHVEIWSGAEFEEQLRLRAEFLLKRFVEGIVFPDAADELRRFVDDFPDLTDEEALGLMAAVLDRPALQTPFLHESYLPAFQRAIDDTIRALNTGLWQTREGAEIRRIPSRHHLKSEANRAGIGRVVRELDEVRRLFKHGLADGSIQHCGCGDPNCPTFLVRPETAHALDAARGAALSTFRSLSPGFNVEVR
ncbi:hypothetical protein [Caulobacter mirabilis]|uniref:Restriction endonuclease type IV Mrr domain-containing protein n=1 Tax=Caulobacter mirabilis TaxID=69666 RepID=A0A2D2AUL5_9CAUL|nr:hypothetical protein [Caulobacter mirabilis]ATQ41700.1 hypothetical protein CSW64_04365 [Caulobacter mirabilis]